jgi:hypothetical protein
MAIGMAMMAQAGTDGDDSDQYSGTSDQNFSTTGNDSSTDSEQGYRSRKEKKKTRRGTGKKKKNRNKRDGRNLLAKGFCALTKSNKVSVQNQFSPISADSEDLPEEVGYETPSSNDSTDYTKAGFESISRRKKLNEIRRVQREKRREQSRKDKTKREKLRQEEEEREQRNIEKQIEREKRTAEKQLEKKQKKLEKKKEKEGEYEEIDRKKIEKENLERENEEDEWLAELIRKEKNKSKYEKKKKKKEEKKKKRENRCKVNLFAMLRIVATVLVVVQLLTTEGLQSGYRNAVKYVGMGFSPANLAASVVKLDDNTTVDVCFMARKGRGTESPISSKSFRAVDSGSTWNLSGEEGIWIGKRRKMSRPKYISGFDSEGSKRATKATECGTIEIPTTVHGKATTIRIKNVVYVPEMGNTTLLSMGVLDDLGHKFAVGGGVTACYNKRGKRLWEAHKVDGLYQLKPAEYCNLTRDEAHVKWGHISDKLLESMGELEGERSP